MPVIRQDHIGFWAAVGGYVTRPKIDTQFKPGEKVKGYHHGGSTRATVKSLDGSHVESWMTCGHSALDHIAGRISKENLDEYYAFYVLHNCDPSFYENKV